MELYENTAPFLVEKYNKQEFIGDFGVGRLAFKLPQSLHKFQRQAEGSPQVTVKLSITTYFQRIRRKRTYP